MSKLVKTLIVIVGLFLVVSAAGAAYVAFVFDPNDFKNTIQKQVKEQTGRDLTISGNIGLSFFPWLGVQLGGVSLSNAPGFGSDPFAEMKQAQVRVKLMPLLGKKIEVGRVVLEGAVLRLARNAEGTGNWEDLAEQKGKPAKSARGEKAGDMEVASLQIEGLSLKDAAIFWNDAQAGQNYQLSQFNLETGNLSPDLPVDLSSNFNIASTAPAMTASVDLAGKLTADTEQQRYRLEGTELEIIAKGDEIPNVTALLNGLLQLDLQSELLSITDMTLKSEVSGADLPDIHSEMTGGIRGNLKTSLYRVDDLVLSVDAKGESVPGESQQAKLSGNIAIDLDKQRLQAPAIVIEALGSTINADVEGYSILDDPRFSGKLNTGELNPRYIMERLGMGETKTADPGVLAKASVQGQFEATPERLELSQLNARLDDTGLDGSLSVKDFSKPAIRFNMNVDQLDVDRYLPPEAAAAKGADKTAPSKPKGDAGEEEIPVDSIKDLNLNGVLKAGRFKAYGLQFTNATVLVSAANGTLKIEPLTSDFYNGRVKMATTVDASGNTPNYALAANIDAVQAGPFLKALTGKDKIDGLANIQINLQSLGKTVNQIKRGLGGSVDFRFANGAVKGFNLGQMLRSAKARLEGKTVSEDSTAQTDFTALTGSAKIVKGVVKNYDLDAKSPAFRVSGEGEFDLVQESMDYLANIAVVKTTEGQGGAGLSDLKGVSIPLKCKGGFDTPVTKLCVPDIGGALKAKAQAKIDAKKAEARGKLKEKEKEKKEELREKFDDKLKGLFGKDRDEKAEPEPAAKE